MDCPFTLEQLDHIVLYVRDLEKSVAFYRMLGGQVQENPGRSALIPLGPRQRILLHPDPDYVAPSQGNLQHFNLRIEGARDIDEVLDYIRANGAEPYDGPRDAGRGDIQFRVRDPDGNQVELRMKK